MNRSLKLSMLIALALGSTHALAETLGSVHVKSTLSQPLLAEIPINAASPAELQSITVQLASVEDFTRAGIVGGRPGVPLTFSVVTSNNQPVIRITSSVPVEDPYLDLLLEINGGSGGKIIREFAILLDPLKNAPVAAAPSPSPRRGPARPSRASGPTSAQTRHVPASAGAEAPPANAGKGQYGPVKSGDTLSSIARESRLSGVSMNQMLVALKQANPDAFYRDNINTLKRGAILRIPTASEAQSLAVIAAIAEVHRQNSDWRSGTIGKPTTVADSATRATASSAPTAKGRADADRLALVSTTEQKGSSGPGGKTGGKADTSADGLRQELQRTQESLSSVQQQSSDLKVRLQDLTEINGKNVKLLSLKDSEIADLQKKLASARKSAGLPAVAATTAAAATAPVTAKSVVPASPAVTPAAALTPPAAALPAAASTAAVTAATSAATPPVVAASAPAPVAQPAPVVTTPMPAAPAPVVVEQAPWYMQTWAWAAGAIAVVILVLLALLGRRRKAQAQSADAPPSIADRFVPEFQGHDKGDTDQNELLDQLAEHPDDIGLHLELVALYYSRRDVDHFEAAAEAMHAHITDTDQNEWQDVLHMGEDLAPGHPLFDHHAEVPPPAAREPRRTFDLDDYASDAPPAKAMPAMPPLPTPPVKKVSEYNFNFDLTAPGSAGAGRGAASADDLAHAPAPSPARPAIADSELHAAAPAKSATSWDIDEVESAMSGGFKESELSSSHSASDDFNDDPVDTKLDLARAYIDMGDPDGARAMLGEVVKEGSQIQRDIAKRLLETLS